jgi:hypothetical protein
LRTRPRGEPCDLVITAPKDVGSNDFEAYFIPRDGQKPAQAAPVSNVRRFRDGGTTYMSLGKDLYFRAEYSMYVWKFFIEDKEARQLSAEEKDRLIQNSRIPGISKIQTPLFTPFDPKPSGQSRLQAYLRQELKLKCSSLGAHLPKPPAALKSLFNHIHKPKQ